MNNVPPPPPAQISCPPRSRNVIKVKAEMKLDWIWLRPKFNVSVLIRDTQESDTETQRRSCDIRSGDRSSAVRSRGNAEA